VLRNNPHIVGTNEKPKNLSPNALHVSIFREMFADFFELTLDNGHTEELEPDDTREWFRLRGANMDAVEKGPGSRVEFPQSRVLHPDPTRAAGQSSTVRSKTLTLCPHQTPPKWTFGNPVLIEVQFDLERICT
jgi:hypothetical protein